MTEVFVGLGANLGDPAEHFRKAIEALGEAIEIEAVSSLYRTEPVGLRDQPFFLNAVLWGRTSLEPRDLIDLFETIEQEMGRQREVSMGPRTLDLDLLLFGGWLIKEPGVRVPHPRMAERRFVLAPLAEIAPAVVHPGLKRTAGELLAALPAAESVERLTVEGWPPQVAS
jgi:2-amino-4-hydroxy-6-hydroxymethyldihydropteridine diphosphokinase